MIKQITREDRVAQFHEACSHPIDQKFTADSLTLRYKLIQEESEELLESISDVFYQLYSCPEKDRAAQIEAVAGMIKEMGDLQVVLSGLAVTFGINLDVAFNRVHGSNMSKLGDDGLPLLREDGKILKGPNYKDPNLDDLAADLVDR